VHGSTKRPLLDAVITRTKKYANSPGGIILQFYSVVSENFFRSVVDLECKNPF